MRSELLANQVGEIPDLISAIGVNGIEGYVRANELYPEINTREEAREHMEWMLQNTAGYREIPVYDLNGSIVDQFHVTTTVDEVSDEIQSTINSLEQQDAQRNEEPPAHLAAQISKDFAGYPVNSKGETYGDQTMFSASGIEPDLRAAIGTNGEHGYIRTSDNWTFLVTIPRSVITQDATTLFYVQLLFQGLFLLIIIYLCLRNYYTLRQNRQVQRSLEAVGQTYDCLVQVDAVRNRCDVLKLAPPPKKKGPPIKTYSDFLAMIHPTVYRAEDWKTFCDIFSLSRLQALHQGGRLYLEYERRGEDAPRWVSAEALTAPDASGQEPVILAFRQIHDTKCAELEKNRLLQESLQSALTLPQQLWFRYGLCLF